MSFGPGTAAVFRWCWVFAGAVVEASRDADQGEGSEVLEELLRRRRDEVGDRIEQLHERQQQLADRLTGGGTSPETLVDAAASAAEAKAHAKDAHVRSGKTAARWGYREQFGNLALPTSGDQGRDIGRTDTRRVAGRD